MTEKARSALVQTEKLRQGDANPAARIPTCRRRRVTRSARGRLLGRSCRDPRRACRQSVWEFPPRAIRYAARHVPERVFRHLQDRGVLARPSSHTMGPDGDGRAARFLGRTCVSGREKEPGAGPRACRAGLFACHGIARLHRQGPCDRPGRDSGPVPGFEPATARSRPGRRFWRRRCATPGWFTPAGGLAPPLRFRAGGPTWCSDYGPPLPGACQRGMILRALRQRREPLHGGDVLFDRAGGFVMTARELAREAHGGGGRVSR